MKSKQKTLWPRCETMAIHGYLVKHSPFERLIWIEKGGVLICHVENWQQAHRVIAVLSESESEHGGKLLTK